MLDLFCQFNADLLFEPRPDLLLIAIERQSNDLQHLYLAFRVLRAHHSRSLESSAIFGVEALVPFQLTFVPPGDLGEGVAGLVQPAPADEIARRLRQPNQ